MRFFVKCMNAKAKMILILMIKIISYLHLFAYFCTFKQDSSKIKYFIHGITEKDH